MLTQTYEDGKGILYSYDNDGNLATATDTDTGITTTYFYDFIGRVRRTEEKGTNFDRTILYVYDANNNMTALEETTNGVWNRYSYDYDEDNRLEKVTNFNVSTSYGYDDFGRLESRATNYTTNNIVTETFGYNGNSTQVQSMTSNAKNNRNVTYTYTYDNNGNIASVTSGGKTTTYYYDTANQLIRENNEAGGYTHTWRYDDAGNVILRREYAYTTANSGTVLRQVDYHYENANWGDLMTGYTVTDKYGNTSRTNITFDLIANTLSDGTRTYTWDHGRRLRTVTKGGTTWTYSYDTDGLRTKRASGSTVYTYRYSGDQLRQMWVGSNSMTFVYNAEGPMAVNFNGTTYYYTRNLQGDITGLVDSNGNSVVEYTYDAWGNPVNPANTVDSDGIIGVSGSLASTLGKYNPFRYRGYIYDHETGLYYLQSRYYNPEIGRFINTDNIEYIGTNGLLSYNLFAYCGNNPVMEHDPTGMFWQSFWDSLKQTFQEASGYFAAALGFSQIDTIAPDPADIATGIMLIGGALACVGITINKTVASANQQLSSNILNNTNSISDELGSIASSFGNYYCKEAADSMVDYLTKKGQHGEVISITYVGGRGFIWSDIKNRTISSNGTHVGVVYNGMVYCNVHPYGLPESTWINDFYGTGTKLVSKASF